VRVYDIGGGEGPEVVSNKILTVPNLLSFARLAILPWLYFTTADGTSEGLLRGLVIGFFFGITDWIDGYVARRFNQVTKLGKLLDPVSDRLFILTVVIALVVVDLLPLWVVIAIGVRDVLMLTIGLIMLARGVQPPEVTRLGKTATFGLMWSFPFLLAAGIIGEPADPQPVWWWIGMVSLTINLVLYWLTAAGYLRIIRQGAPPEPD
jgi:cardiolipin synthase